MEEQFNPLGSTPASTVVDKSLQQKPSIALRSIANGQRPAVSIEPGSTLSLPASEQRLRQQPFHLHPLLQSPAIATRHFAGCARCERALRNIAPPKGLLEKTRMSRQEGKPEKNEKEPYHKPKTVVHSTCVPKHECAGVCVRALSVSGSTNAAEETPIKIRMHQSKTRTMHDEKGRAKCYWQTLDVPLV